MQLRSLISWPSSKDTILVYQSGFSIAIWRKRLKSASEKCIHRGRWEIQQREEAKEIPSRKRAQMYIIAGSDVGAHVQGQARVWRSHRKTPAGSQQEHLDSPTTRNWIMPTIGKIFFFKVYWSRVDLQCCVSFRCNPERSQKWILSQKFQIRSKITDILVSVLWDKTQRKETNEVIWTYDL